MSITQAMIDQAFFSKEDIKVGDCLSYYGVLDHGSKWKVTSITSFRQRSIKAPGANRKRYEQYDRRKVPTVRFTRDEITMQNTKTGETTRAGFEYVRGSSRWWVEK